MTKVIHKIAENARSLHIKRIDRQDKAEFVEIANSHFVGDYGMLIKHLLTLYKKENLVSYLLEEQIAMREEFREIIAGFQGEEPEEQEYEEIKMLNGRIIKKPIKKPKVKRNVKT